MNGPRGAGLALMAVGITAALTACKPPPTDEALERELPDAQPVFASAPLPSPETDGAIWTVSARNRDRIIYGVPGKPALMALTCIAEDGAGNGPARLRVSRISPADEGASALLALVGNGHIARIKVEAAETSGAIIWRGEVEARGAAEGKLAPLSGARALTATVPGAGMVTLNPSAIPMEMIESCAQR